MVIDGPAGALQASLEEAASPGGFYAVVCHPHPLYGGTMDNKVVTTVARALRDAGIPTVRFNFRGIGASAGSYDQGTGETADADAVAAWGAQHWPGKQLVMAGFSFGGVIALRVALQRPTARLITIAPAITLFEPSSSVPGCPWLIVQGDADDVVDPKAVSEWCAALALQPRLVMLPGVGHFFHGRLQELRDTVIDWISSG